MSDIPQPGSTNGMFLRCATNIPIEDELCSAVLQALRETAPKMPLTVVNPDVTDSAAPQSLVISLHVDHLTDDSISGHLEWYREGEKMTQRGPTISLDVMGRQLSADHLPQFAAGLIEASPEIFGKK